MTELAASEGALAAFAGRPSGRFVILGARLVLAALFAAAAAPTILDPVSFARDVENYHLLSPELVAVVAVVLPPLEMVLALALLTGVHARGAAVVTGGLLLGFAGGMAQAIARGIDLDCGCFGSAMAMEVSGWTVARNLVLALLAGLVAAAPDVVLLAVRRPVVPPPAASA